METDKFVMENFSSNWPQKLKAEENKIRGIFIQCLVFNKIKTIIPLTLVGYELRIADSVLRTSSAI